MTHRIRILATAALLAACPLVVYAANAQAPVQRPGMTGAPKGTAAIRGRVTAADTGKPLRRAQLALTGETPTQRFTTSTNVRGEYEIKNVPEGRYTLSVSRGGYLRMQYGERRPGDGAKPLQLAEGQQLDRVDVTLHRAGLISGRLVDETGDPIAGVSVHAMRQAYYLGRRRLVPMGPILQTDDTGQYRLTGLEPGDYYVMAVARDTWTVKGPPPRIFGYAVTYFPGAAAPSSAQRVPVVSGQEVSNVDFALVASRTATVSGFAMRADGAVAAGASVSLSQNIMGPMGGTSSSAGSARVAADGSWTLEKVTPGEYELSMVIDERGRPRERVSMNVSVQGADMTGITLTADAGSDVSGEVTTESGDALPTATVGGRLRVVLDPVGPDRQGEGIISGSDVGLVGSDGRFTLRAQSGENVLRVSGLPARWAIRTVEIGGRDYAGAPFEVAAGKPLENIRVVLSDKFPGMMGTITNERGMGAEGTVLLFSTDETTWSVPGAIRAARADQYGLYRYETVRPGEYLAIALEFAPQWQIQDPEYLAELATRATKVTVREGQAEQVNLRIRAR